MKIQILKSPNKQMDMSFIKPDYYSNMRKLFFVF